MSRSVPQAGGGLNASPPAHTPVPPVPLVQIASAKPQELPPPTGFALLPGQARTLLPGGRILVTGGASKDGPVADAWLLDPATGLTAKLPAGLREARAFHTATILPDGAVLILGGVGADGLAATELFTPETFTFNLLPVSGLTPRAHHTATLLIDGRVLIAGGTSADGTVLDSAELLDARSRQKIPADLYMGSARQDQTAQLLADGGVRLSGGKGRFGSPLGYGEVFDSAAPLFRMEPTPLEPAPDLRVEASIPGDRDRDVPVDTTIALRFSHPVGVASANTDTIQLQRSASKVPAKVVPAEGGMLAFVTPLIPLEPGTAYTLGLAGVTDTNGGSLPETAVAFTTAGGKNSAETGKNSPSQAPASAGAAPVAADHFPPLKAPPGVTALSGRAATLDSRGLQNVTLRIDDKTAKTDGTGRFLLTGISAGHHELVIDGRTAGRANSVYGVFEVGVNMPAGQTTVLNYTIWMTPLDTAHAVRVPFPTASEVVVTTPLLPGLEFRIPANTTITDIDGKVASEISITPISIQQPPFPLPAGVRVPIYFTIQPGGGYIAVAGASGKKGGRLIYPNTFKQPRGTRFDFWNYDADEKGWFIYGRGSVSADLNSIVPDPGVEIYELTGAMVVDPGLGASGGAGGKKAGEPVDLASGLFVYQKTDLVLPDVIPLALTRTYRQSDGRKRAFGIGTTHNYDIFIVGNQWPYTYQEVVMPDGSRVRFDRISPGEAYNDAVYQSVSAPGEFYGAKIGWNGGGWNLTKRDGTVLAFPDGSNQGTPQKAALLSIRDRNGNQLTLMRDSLGNLTRAISPNGRYIAFTYDTDNRITQAQDNIGRTVQYVYDGPGLSGRLSQVTDANLGVWQYGYNALDQMTTITDARNILYLTNEYDANGRVFRQTQADNGVYQFAYTTDANGNTTQTDVTDPRNHVRRLVFNPPAVSPNGFRPAPFDASDTLAQGTSLQAATSTVRQPGTNLVTSTTDPLGRTTAYTYDALGNETSVTRLSGTPNAVTTTFTYDDTYSNVTSVTDPLGHTTRFTYDAKGNLTSATDPLGNTSIYTYNSAGQVITAADPNGNVTLFGYTNGDLISVTDPLGRATTGFYDGAGRVIATISPAGDMTLREYNALNLVTKITDPASAITSMTYDKNANLLTVVDARNNTTTYTYDNMDRLATRKDALLAIESYQYDGNGNRTQFTDRRNKVTTLQYDDLNRLSFAGYGTQPGPTYESTMSYTYDAMDRLTQVVDSITGTVTRNYDGLDRLTSEITPQGTVTSGYDAAGRRSTMTVAGQPAVAYTYDNANRMLQMMQGSANVTFSYDAGGRRLSLTLPNGVTTNYAYDSASELTGITYQSSTNTLGDLSYTYDTAGRRSSIGGSFARTGVPQAVSSAAYNANNQLTQWGGSAIGYDANGNMTSDSTKTYSWDARNHLALIGGGATASLQYDPFGRRVSKSVGGSATSYLYDGANAVQELSGSAPTANLLNAALDEVLTRSTATGTSSYLADALGSTVALADNAGVIQSQYNYEPFGQTTVSGAANTNPVQFTGRENDATGLYFYRARYYNATIQRFISEDPLTLGGGDTNLYGYAGSDPTDFTDPFGLQRYDAKTRFCKSSPEARILASIEFGAVRWGITGAVLGAGGGAAGFGFGAIPGAILGGFLGGTFGAARGALTGSAFAGACSLGGAYK